ncbi:MAG: XRE family transcriptional regulator [Acidimicrobiaceae bacterium]|nr:XRE family transcriptional regulator [Acidimicrobiaceae bacterium]
MRKDENELGVRIASARRGVGLTQEECATQVGMDRSALAKIEIGRRGVSATELVQFAQVFDMRVEWFFDDAPQAVLSRRQAAEPGASSPSVDRFTERLAREVEFLQRTGGIELAATPAMPFPETVEQAEDAATEARGRMGYDREEPSTELSKRVASLGLLVFSWELGDSGADGASILLEQGGVAVVNGSYQTGRRRLTLAHELGHYLFGDEYSTDWSVVGTLAPTREKRIDLFARSVLLPSAAMESRWRGGDNTRVDAVCLASEYRVDMTTLARRLDELGVASPEESALVRATRTRQSDIVELGLLVADELAPPMLPDAYVKAVLNVYRSEQVTAARALGLLLDTWQEEDLPDLHTLPADAVWSFVS